MLIEQLYWKAIWNCTIQKMDNDIRHLTPSMEEQQAFKSRLTKLAKAQFINYGHPHFI